MLLFGVSHRSSMLTRLGCCAFRQGEGQAHGNVSSNSSKWMHDKHMSKGAQLRWCFCRGASLEVVRSLLAAGPRGRHPSIKDVSKRGLTPLGEALVAGRCDVADQLAQEVRWRSQP